MEMAQRSEKFHSLMGDVLSESFLSKKPFQLSRKTDLLLETLCTDPKISDLAAAEVERTSIEEKVAVMEKIYETVCEQGAGFVEDLVTGEFNAFGKRVSYSIE